MGDQFNFKKSVLKHLAVSFIPFFIIANLESSGKLLLAPFDGILTLIDEVLFADSSVLEVFSFSLVILTVVLYLAASVSKLIYTKIRPRSHRRFLEITWTLLIMPVSGLFSGTSIAFLAYTMFVILFLPFT